MDGQRQRPQGRRRRRKQREEGRAPAEPVLIAARRPNSPVVQRGPGRGAFAATPALAQPVAVTPGPDPEAADAPVARPPTRRDVRIVRVAPTATDEHERLRLRLLERVVSCDGRSAITRAATEYTTAGFTFPEEQEVQLQLLEHFDESTARGAIDTLTRLLELQAPLKRPVLDQRLRRLEESADEALTRDAAAALRRNLR